MDPQYRGDPRRLRISDRDREQVIGVLGQAAGDGRLTLDEYADRASQVYAVRTRGELEEIVVDLPVTLDAPSAMPVVASTPQPPNAPSRVERLVAVFSQDNRRGRWAVPGLVQARAVFGECVVELHEAVIQQPYTVIDARAIFGKVTVVVPEGIDVRLGGITVFGARNSRIQREPIPGAPIVDIRATVWFGEVQVTPPGW